MSKKSPLFTGKDIYRILNNLFRDDQLNDVETRAILLATYAYFLRVHWFKFAEVLLDLLDLTPVDVLLNLLPGIPRIWKGILTLVGIKVAEEENGENEFPG